MCTFRDVGTHSEHVHSGHTVSGNAHSNTCIIKLCALAKLSNPDSTLMMPTQQAYSQMHATAWQVAPNNHNTPLRGPMSPLITHRMCTFRDVGTMYTAATQSSSNAQAGALCFLFLTFFFFLLLFDPISGSPRHYNLSEIFCWPSKLMRSTRLRTCVRLWLCWRSSSPCP